MFQIGKMYSFDIYPTQIIENNFKHCKCVALMDFETANNDGKDILALHNQVYPYLPANTINNPRSYSYAKFLLADGLHRVIGLPWIISSTIRESNLLSIHINMEDITTEDIAKLGEILTANGYRKFTITTREI